MKVVAARARVDLHRTKDIVLGDDSGGTGILLILAPVAQLDRASDYGSGGWGFESLRACFLNQPSSQPTAGGRGR